VVTIATARGRTEDVIVHRSQVDERSLEVAYIGERDGRPAPGRTSTRKSVRPMACLGSKISRSLRTS
jgi:hypothetical protein